MLVSLIITLVVVGVILYLVETYIPMSPPIKTVLRILVVLILIIYILRIFAIRLP